jgi:hypothetical protein
MMIRFLYAGSLPRGARYFSSPRNGLPVEDRTDVPGWMEDAIQAEERDRRTPPVPLRRGVFDFIVLANPVLRILW